MARVSTTLFVVFSLSTFLMGKTEKISPSTSEFFADIGTNLTKVRWAHAVNNKADLTAILGSDNADMIEADVVLGTLNGSTEIIPIMAHPPATESDLSLEQFLEDVVALPLHGVKLDFKSIDVFNASRELLATYRPKMTIPVWLNADIVSGPVDATSTPVDAESFLSGAAETFPECTLSIGWTTRYGSTYDISEGKYTTEHVDEMIRVIEANNVNQSITYPVRAGLVAESLTEMEDLVSRLNIDSTLTIWTSDGDHVDTEKLQEVIKKIGVDRVYLDLTDDILSELDLSSSGMKVGAMAFGTLLAAVILFRLF